MAQYKDTLTLEAARKKYFHYTGLNEKGYQARWVLVELGPFPFIFPNTKSRKMAVPFHDFHHILTGYDTDLVGEGEIGAWELASGCSQYAAAFVLNTMAATTGFFLSPKRILRAFVRGRKSRNLYGRKLTSKLMATQVGKLRQELML